MATAAILDLEVKIVPNHKKHYSIIKVMPKLVVIDTSYIVMAHMVQKISLFMFFNMASAAILDLEVKMVQKSNKYHSIISVMPEIVGIDTSFVIMVHLVQEISLFMFLK
jgi:hypothetical protein